MRGGTIVADIEIIRVELLPFLRGLLVLGREQEQVAPGAVKAGEPYLLDSVAAMERFLRTFDRIVARLFGNGRIKPPDGLAQTPHQTAQLTCQQETMVSKTL